MKRLLRDGGFTLIELLTVIAIISILAAMTVVVAPRVIEKAKLASLSNDLRQVATACQMYRTSEINKGKLPLSYGSKIAINGGWTHCFKPYVEPIGLFRVTDVYDRFSVSYDTDRDGRLSLLEFSPMGTKTGPDSYAFVEELYGGANLSNEVNQQLAASPRPIIYIPVNEKQAKVVAQYYWELAQANPQAGWNATRWVAPPNATAKNDVTQLVFPPNRYDDFVLISVGPDNDTGGILTPPASFMSDLAAFPEEDWYHILTLRAYFLATRDANENGLLDFDYNARKQGEGKAASYTITGLHLLPNGTGDEGPVIFHNTGG